MTILQAADDVLKGRERPMAYETGIGRLNVMLPGLLTIAGAAGHGKSTVAQIVSHNLGLRAHLRVAFLCEPHRRDAIAMRLARSLRAGPGSEVRPLDDGIRAEVGNRLKFIAYAPGEQPTADCVVEAADDAGAAGVRVLVIDPWDQILIPRRPDETITEVTGNTLGRLKAVAMRYQMLVLVCTHLTLEPGRAPTIYDIFDSQHFARRSDQVLIVWRPDLHVNTVGVEACKCPIDSGGAIRSMQRQWMRLVANSSEFRLEAAPDPFQQRHHDDEMMLPSAM